MKDNKTKLDELKREAIESRREEKVQKFEEELTHVAYDIYEESPRKFRLVVFKYNPKTGKVVVSEDLKFSNAVIGLAFGKEKENMKTYKRSYGRKDENN